MSWKDSIRKENPVEEQEASSWKNSITKESQPEMVEDPSMLESFARGAEQGLTFGFGDELNAALEAATSDKTYDQAVAESRAKFE